MHSFTLTAVYSLTALLFFMGLVYQSSFCQTYNSRLVPVFKRSDGHLVLVKQPRFVKGIHATPVDVDAQTPQKGKPVTIGTTWTIHSKILNEDRQLLIHLPLGYRYSTRQYPVMYLLDGPKEFEHVVGIVDFLARNWRIPPMIVVGVANKNRLHDMTTAAIRDTFRFTDPFNPAGAAAMPVPHVTGGAGKFMHFLSGEVTSFVENHYRTAPFRILAGHSLAGYLTVYALLAQPKSFNAYIAISPSLWWNDEELVKKAKAELNKLPLNGRFFYLTVGDRNRPMTDVVMDFDGPLELTHPKGFHWWYKVMPDQTHESQTHLAIYGGLETIFLDWRIPKVFWWPDNSTDRIKKFEAHFTRASKIYGYTIKPPEALVNQMGYEQLQSGHSQRAIDIFNENIKIYPNSPNVYDSMADALQATGQLKDALKDRNESVKLAMANEDPRLKIYKKKRDALQKRIKEGTGK